MNSFQKIRLFTLTNSNFIEVKIINYGGTIISVKTPDKEGRSANIVLGFDKPADYLNDHPYLGAIIGRYANRIANGKFSLNGREYILAQNDGFNHLHGGNKGFDKVIWNVENITDKCVKLTYVSADGEEGYPGNLNVTVSYTLTEYNELVIDYLASTDKATPVNLTNHSYFNLSGDTATDILGHTLFINAHKYTPVDDNLIPTGDLKNVKGTPLDFTSPCVIGARINDIKGGYDHNFVLNNESKTLKLASGLYDPVSGRKLEVFTTEPGLQFYSGNFLDGTLKDAMGNRLKKYSGLCLETQHFPDSLHHSDFPPVILTAEEVYSTTTVYKFSIV